ncbi:MAG: hypothetical protein GXP27_12910 [Planctomycetes bacterium]|nr:hypothetical protein [Planctomycetota bacterium]
MNRLTSQQRKLVYLAGIVALSIPILILGMPSTGEPGSGGSLAALRQKYDLGESTLGKVDPTSAALNLVLLGLRGIAVDLLWIQLDHQKDTKNWAQMRATTESIILLQPHFKKVWRYHSWNLAYNVSAEWDAVEDRFYWVKEGIKFGMRGCQRNERYPELFWDVGNMCGNKIGRADEWRFYRKFFRKDPDEERFGGRADPEINPAGDDNYLVAKRWFFQANDAEERYEQHLMMRALFRASPYRAQFGYAHALNREGTFDEKARIAWEESFREWTQEYGKMRFHTPDCVLYLEADEKDIHELAQENGVDESVIRHWLDRTQNVTNYRYWRTRALWESEPETVAAHRMLYDGEQAFKRGELDQAQKLLEEGLKKLSETLTSFEDMEYDDTLIEEALWGLLIWQKILQLEGTPVPEKYPLKDLWEREQNRLPDLEYDFKRKYGGV